MVIFDWRPMRKLIPSASFEPQASALLLLVKYIFKILLFAFLNQHIRFFLLIH
jgi:hypothetical protein